MGAVRVFRSFPVLLLLSVGTLAGDLVPVNVEGYSEGPVAVEVRESDLLVSWRDSGGVRWEARFNRDPSKALIGSLGPAGGTVLRDAEPFYQVETGIRRKGWNAFFDYPPSHSEGTAAHFGGLDLESLRVETAGGRVRIHCAGFEAGPFSGSVVYTFFDGSRLVLQQALVSTHQPGTAFLYDAGIEYRAREQEQVGRNMATPLAYYDTEGELRKETANGLQPERVPFKVRYRAIASAAGRGSVAAFPPPHQYFVPRDFTSNLSQNWHRSWRGRVSLGIRSVRDTNWQFYPWANAPPGSRQSLSMLLLVGDGTPEAVLEDVLRYTNRDRFRELSGYKTLASHFHLAYTVQALEHGMDWVPPFKTVLKDMGVNAAVIMDFHGDGHPRDLTELRLQELDSFFRACRAQSDKDFLLIPSEEANVHLGGHWGLIFPNPVYWWMNRPEAGAYASRHRKYGAVYSVADAKEMLDLVRQENGIMYQTHARTKGSTGYPDAILDTEHFRDPRYFGAGWKAMPTDYSTPRLGERTLTLLDDLHNWGMDKRLMGEVDVFQFDHTHEVYGHMNVNYLKMGRLPRFDSFGEMLEPLRTGEFFVTTGEVLLPSWKIGGTEDEIDVTVEIDWTFPLKFAEVVWGDGRGTRREIIDLSESGEFGSGPHQWKVRAPGWAWARVAVWDVAANGAFVNPVRR